MAASKITDGAEALADSVSEGGRRTGARARRAGERTAKTLESSADEGARRIRRGADAYDSVVGDVDGRVASLEETIRRNPLAAAGAALFVGVVLGRFVL